MEGASVVTHNYMLMVVVYRVVQLNVIGQLQEV